MFAFIGGTIRHAVQQRVDELQLGERLRTKKRVVLDPQGKTPAEALWQIGSIESAIACGFPDAGGDVAIDRNAPELLLVDDADVLDAIVYSGNPRMFVSA